jgi:sugar O-acyltransferase (sialic acid O-acetyltransferase NeuD family)
VSREPLLLLGAGGHARACIDVIEAEGRFAISGLVGLREQLGSRVLGYPVLATDAELAGLRRDSAFALVAVGQIRNSEPRVRLFELALRHGFEMARIVSPSAHVSMHASVGEGTIIMHGAIVNAGATVGRNCILNSRALIEHDVVIEDHCHISTGAIVNGDARVAASTFVGSLACIRQGIRIGAGSVIGMGQRVSADCAPATQLAMREGD